MKVLHIITRLISGGADENTIYTIEGADPARYSIDLVVGAQSEPASIAQVTKARVLTLNTLVRPLRPWTDIRALWQLVRMIRKERYDIVHTHTAKAGMLGRFAAWLAGAPCVIHSLHGATFHPSLPGPVRWLYRFLERLAAHCTDHFIAVGNDLRDRYLAAGVGRPQQYSTIRSGFDLTRFLLGEEEIDQKRSKIRKELGFDDKDIIFGSISRLEPRKGHAYFFSACQRLIHQHSHLHLVCAGDGEYRPQIEAEIDRLGLKGRVHLLGFRSDIEDVIAAMDVVVLTSLWEGLPRVLVQAAALQKPIVTFAVEGASELVCNGVNGYIVPLRDVQLLQRRLKTFVEQPSLIKSMGRKSRGFVTSEWDRKNMVRAIYSLYDTYWKKRH